jgi:hypothetical protein
MLICGAGPNLNPELAGSKSQTGFPVPDRFDHAPIFAMDNAHNVQPELLNLDAKLCPSVSDEVALNGIQPALANRLFSRHLIEHRPLSMSCRASSSE